ncbi:MAG: restriction endonuclease [Oscillospiraceae bacterium]|jgi:HJR/Mrr/RecB family endonuclease
MTEFEIFCLIFAIIITIIVKIDQFLDLDKKNNSVSAKKSKQLTWINISSIDGMEGQKFEYFCADLLRDHGFTNVEVTPGSGDQGVDIIATKDDIRYAIQCKNYTSRLGNTPIQQVHAGKSFYNCHVGVVMTNSTFTSGAISLAEATGTLLWDRTTIHQMMRNY